MRDVDNAKTLRQKKNKPCQHYGSFHSLAYRFVFVAGPRMAPNEAQEVRRR